ncbi:MAG: hypothetical protein RLZZ241_738 [Bacteroidota bacterium]|jgi:predicted metalloprotease with PDZ domain
MRSLSYKLLLLGLLHGGLVAQLTPIDNETTINVTLDLIDVSEDRVKVTIAPVGIPKGAYRFFIPKTVPGTYSEDNYGVYIEDLKAFGELGESLEVHRENVNSWFIEATENIHSISYWVNDSYDMEGGIAAAPFSPAGTNILAEENFMLNLHGFIGYFEGLSENPYRITVKVPESLYPATSLSWSKSVGGDYVFLAKRYFEVVDNPIQFSNQPSVSFQVDDISIILSVYSPNSIYSSEQFKPAVERMMQAQKAFLGDITGTKTYTILLYLSSMQQDALGFGALEHNTSTVVVLPEQMTVPQLEEAIIDVVSHEFFHTVTPLNVHSEEIHFFDFNFPKMSRHLWMYEGTTEYFANLFQIREGLISESEFYRRIYTKILNAKGYNDSLSFTEMSKNVLIEPYAGQYTNVYEKGALINMSLDILLRSLSNGAYGLIDLMRELSKKYDTSHPFKDTELFEEIVALTYPELRDFFELYVIGNTPINYNLFLNKVGLSVGSVALPSGYFLTDMESAIPFVDISPSNPNEIFVRAGIELNTFLLDLGVQAGDILEVVNGLTVDLEGIREIIMQSLTWTPDTHVEMRVRRGSEILELSGKAGNPTYTDLQITPLLEASDAQIRLRAAWLKG